MDYDEALQYLLSLGHETLAIKLGLRNTKLLLNSLNNPQHSFPAVQIAGTNGKGSTASFLDSICRHAGIRTGLYTSPHLESITERIKIGGSEISREDFADCATTVRDTANRLLRTGDIEALPTFFEHVTAIALVAFRDARVEFAILETGLGGRLDATTAVEAPVCAITDIGFDHEEYLGNTIKSIAAEKAAIIHEGSTAVIAPQTAEALKVILDRCKEVNVTPVLECTKRIEEFSKDGRCKVTFKTPNDTYESIWLGLRGRHQIENAGVAIQLAEILRTRGHRITRETIVEGLETASHPGRLELFGDKPAFLLDGAHNPSGAQALQEFLQTFRRHPLTIIFGTMRDKRIDQIAEYLFPLADDLILTEIDNPRSASSITLLDVAKKLRLTNVTSTTTSRDALKLAIEKTPAHGMICITGSLYLIGEIRTELRHSEKRLQKTT
ncbi:MAG TPA: folylpolyglutamate synthase/dihydrofolate synthase family protein [Pyrinomonadaceae bacterium]|jgi:dihydrofolate synthase/folylpolyglutamate synthase|nr:folylpolyglutamate synthase/dihydrofolate synthase family protein [Pyrinomonadaceae bacterium]